MKSILNTHLKSYLVNYTNLIQIRFSTRFFVYYFCLVIVTSFFKHASYEELFFVKSAPLSPTLELYYSVIIYRGIIILLTIVDII